MVYTHPFVGHLQRLRNLIIYTPLACFNALFEVWNNLNIHEPIKYGLKVDK
jgi:hypothetical protein